AAGHCNALLKVGASLVPRTTEKCMFAKTPNHKADQCWISRPFCPFDRPLDIPSPLSQLASSLIDEIRGVKRIRKDPDRAYHLGERYETLDHCQGFIRPAMDQQAQAAPVQRLDQQRFVLYGLSEHFCPLGSLQELGPLAARPIEVGERRLQRR